MIASCVAVCVAALVAAARGEQAVRAPAFVVDLDKPPAARWAFLAQPTFVRDAKEASKYFGQYLSGALASAVEFIALELERLVGREYAQEMEAAAGHLQMDKGLLVLLNFLYELRGINGSQPDTTGGRLPPHHPLEAAFRPGACTSMVAAAGGGVVHGRNLDWNLPPLLRNMSFECQFHRGGQLVAHGGCIAGYMGLLTGMRRDKFSISLDERNKGGNVLVDGFTGLLAGGKPVTHALRDAIINSDSYADAVKTLSTVRLAAPAYFIVGGVAEDEGVIITRSRSESLHPLSLTEPTKRWWVLQTNYDNWEAPPAVDNRRLWGDYFVEQIGQAGFANPKTSWQSLAKVMTTWPIRNGFTAQTLFMSAKQNHFEMFAVYNVTVPQ